MISLRIDQKLFPKEELPLFKNFNLEVENGEVLAILGPSGVGKSTLLRIISGIDQQFDGELIIEGQSADQSPPCGFVFQDPRLLPWCTSAGNISAVVPDIDDGKILALLSEVGLNASVITQYPHQLSGGMQRRLALARALAVNSRLLLLDEPFISLDSKLVSTLRDSFSKVIKDKNITTVLVTHNSEDVAALADRLVFLNGRPAQSNFAITMENRDHPRSKKAIQENLIQIEKYTK